MPSKLRILAGYLLFWPYKNLIFSVRRRFSRSDGDSFAAEVCPFLGHSASPKDGRGMPIPQRSIASVYAVHTAGALSVWSPVNFRDGSRAKAVLTTPRNTPSGLCARSTRACLLSSGDFFQSMRIGGDGSPYPPL